MAQVNFYKGLGIASISGRLGNCIFYTRNGKQYVRRASNTDELPSIIESITDHKRSNKGPSTVHERVWYRSEQERLLLLAV